MKNIVYFDLETQKSADEVGGWDKISRMGMSIGVTFSSARGDYRIYGEKDVHRLQFIRHAKALGFTLDEIKHVLILREKEAYPCGEVRRIGEERLTQLDSQIAELTTFRNQLARAVSRWRRSPDAAPSGDAICTLIERSMAAIQKPASSLERKKQWLSSKAKSINVPTRNAGVRSRSPKAHLRPVRGTRRRGVAVEKKW